jgi:hypothetical protein
MDEMIFDKIPGWDNLLKEKAFAELSPSEKKRVLQFMSEEEYGELRLPLLNATNVFMAESHQIKPDPDFRQQLMDRFAGKQQKKSKVSAFLHILTYRIPAYQVGIAALFLVFIALYINRKDSKRNNTGNSISKIDTVYILKDQSTATLARNTQEPIVSSLISRNPVKSSFPASKSQISASAIPDRYSEQLMNMNRLVGMSHKTKKGNNALDDSLLMKLLVTVN